MTYILVYRGYSISEYFGVPSHLSIDAEVDLDYFKQKFGGNYPFVLIINNYKVSLFSTDKLDGSSASLEAELGIFKGNTYLIKLQKGKTISLEIPISEKLISIINKIRMKDRIPLFRIECGFSAYPLGSYVVDRIIDNEYEVVRKTLPNGKYTDYVYFTTEEVIDLLSKIKYIDIFRIEIPISKEKISGIEILNKCMSELKVAHERLLEGDYREVLNICRNILMNYLIPKKNVEKTTVRQLNSKIIDAIKYPKESAEVYKLIVKGVEATLKKNLEHIHKFIKKDTGELLLTPMREDAEYIFMMLSITIKFLSELSSQ